MDNNKPFFIIIINNIYFFYYKKNIKKDKSKFYQVILVLIYSFKAYLLVFIIYYLYNISYFKPAKPIIYNIKIKEEHDY